MEWTGSGGIGVEIEIEDLSANVAQSTKFVMAALRL